MKWFLDMGTRGKLLAGFGVVVALLVATVVLDFQGDRDVVNAAEHLVGAFGLASDLGEVRTDVNGMRATVLDMMVVSDAASRQAWSAEYATFAKRARDAIDDAVLMAEHAPALSTRLSAIRDALLAYTSATERDIVPSLLAGRADDVKDEVLGVQVERYRKVHDLSREAGEAAVVSARAEVSTSADRARDSLVISLVIGLVAVAAGVALSLLLARAVAGPLVRFEEAARRVTGGNLSWDMQVSDRNDEVGRLERSLAAMAGRLKEQLGQIAQSIDVVAAAAAELSASATQVASGSNETATAVAQTATTIDEVKQTARLSAEKAQAVLDTSRRSVQVSQGGVKAVEETVDKMSRIRAEMESVADAILKLSGHTQAIGEITATVADLAEQSNLLAVNAAIEAARAGEHGRGFAVVAREIKSMAEQSKAATLKVRAILGDVQKAASATVMATERSTKAVDAGTRQAAVAGESIRTLGTAIEDASGSASQVAASAQQQLAEMDQVALAIDSIRVASMQGAQSTRQVQAVAERLHDMGGKLKQLADFYKV